jgi:mRNA interferase MazF
LVKASYVPAEGDFIWMNFDPQAGHEQHGRRPALVLTPLAYNRLVGLAVVCPITSRGKDLPFEVKLRPEAPVSGVVLSDHVKSVDWRQRRTEFAGRADDETVAEVRERLRTLLGM